MLLTLNIFYQLNVLRQIWYSLDWSLLDFLQIDLLIVTALLTLAGYSINDTIVVYDRIREMMQKMQKAKIVDVINAAINQTLSRTLITSFTTILVILSLFLFGGEVLNSFALVLLIGFIVGTYSSIFIATPLVVAFHSSSRSFRK